jgi:hypothetical protein
VGAGRGTRAAEFCEAGVRLARVAHSATGSGYVRRVASGESSRGSVSSGWAPVGHGWCADQMAHP